MGLGAGGVTRTSPVQDYRTVGLLVLQELVGVGWGWGAVTRTSPLQDYRTVGLLVLQD